MTARAPIILTKLGYRIDDAAALIGVSQSKFLELVKQQRMPQPRWIDRCKIWRGDELLDAFNRLTDDAAPSEDDEWGDVLGDDAA